MSGSVEIDFASQDRLTCDHAHLDFLTLEGTFLGNQEGLLALYQGTLQQGNWELEGDQLSLKLLALSTTKTTPYHLEHLQAAGHVAIRTMEGFSAFGSSASYFPEKALPSSGLDIASLGGYFTLLASIDLGTMCKLQDPSGNWIEGSHILLAPTLGLGSIKQPSGCLYFAGATSIEPVFFSAQDLEWNYRSGILKLHHNVQLKHATFGHAYCKDTLHLATTSQGAIAHHWQIVSLESDGPTELTHYSLPTVGSGVIKCRGKMHADLLSGNLLFQAEPQGKILYEGEAGLLSACRVGLNYHPSSRLEHFFAKEHVQILRHSPHSAADGLHLQGALANRLDFFPEKQEILLRGSRSSPALFTDTLQNLSMSAHKVVAKIDSHGKESVRGLGAVRLSFNEMEASHMKHLFSLEP